MESTSKFIFRDHQATSNSKPSETGSTVSSISPVDEDDSEDDVNLQSMTAKGIKHLCSELLELKAASDEEFQQNIFSNYTTFLSIFEEVEGLENELIQLQLHVSNEKKLVNELVDGIWLNLSTVETIEPLEATNDEESTFPDKLEAHVAEATETLDILLTENRVDEALDILEVEEQNLSEYQSKMDPLSDILRQYNLTISESKAALTLQLTQVAKNTRTAAAEFQKALVGLERLGNGNLAKELLLKYYHSRISTGTHDLQNTKSFLNEVYYIRELSKLVFSLISQAAKSFTELFGETPPDDSEFIQWVQEEVEAFSAAFNKYVKSISETSGGLSVAILSMQCALLFCSLLEGQKLSLGRQLVEKIRSSMEEAVLVHVDHLKKVVNLFTRADNWTLSKYLVSGVLAKGYSSSSIQVGKQPEYCLLTNSGRKFVTLLQAMAEDLSPLFAIQLENTMMNAFRDVYMEYFRMLEKVASGDSTYLNNNSLYARDSAETSRVQLSALVNLSTLEAFFSSIITSTFKGTHSSDSSPTQHIDYSVSLSFIQETYCRLRASFCKGYITRALSQQSDRHSIIAESCNNETNHTSITLNMHPSAPLQRLFLELRKIESLSRDEIFQKGWLMELLKELIEAATYFLIADGQISSRVEDDSSASSQQQFILDVQFVAQIAKDGKYFSRNPSDLEVLTESAYISKGLDPRRNPIDDSWAMVTSAKVIERLLKIEKLVEIEEENLLDKSKPTIDGANNCVDDQSDSADNRSTKDSTCISFENIVLEECVELEDRSSEIIISTKADNLEMTVELLNDHGDHCGQGSSSNYEFSSTSTLEEATTEKAIAADHEDLKQT